MRLIGPATGEVALALDDESAPAAFVEGLFGGQLYVHRAHRVLPIVSGLRATNIAKRRRWSGPGIRL